MSLKIKKYLIYDKYFHITALLLKEFEWRFLTFSELEDVTRSLSCPFNDSTDVESVAQKLNDFLFATSFADLEEEIINIKCDINPKPLVSDCHF